MARPLSGNSLKVLAQLGKGPRSIDELAARTGMRKDRVAKVLWHLQSRGWITVSEEVRRLAVYRRLRNLPARKRPDGPKRYATAPHIEALQAAFGIRFPAKRARARTVRRGE